jgi:hypothetical protein
MIDPDLLTEEEKAAIAVLQVGGFLAFTEAKLDDVRELETGRRWRTFRNQGRYDLVLACRKLAGREIAGSPPGDVVDHGAFNPETDLYFGIQGQNLTSAIETVAQLQDAYPELCRQMLIDAVTAASCKNVDELLLAYPALCEQLIDRAYAEETGEVKIPETGPVTLMPIEDMKVDDLVAEAKHYPEIVGEYAMRKKELQEAVQAARDRREILHRDFTQTTDAEGE